ncbi:zona pellucida-like domain-containing protein 1 [Xenentodon cancila]
MKVWESISFFSAYTDIAVPCGASAIDLDIQLCPVIYSGCSKSLLILNGSQGNVACDGTLNASVVPPVVRFSFPIGEGNASRSNLLTSSSQGTGVFTDFSDIHSGNISGVVQSSDPTMGTITYNAELKCFYSCTYPLEYLINNTQVDVSSSSIALKDNNGSFISTLSMALYKDINYTTPLVIPPVGIELRTNVYVQVVCVQCSKDQLTTMLENRDSQRARFYFPAFRFIEQQNETISTYYLHCITRLCESGTCSTFKQCSMKRRRIVETTMAQESITEPSVLTGAIRAKTETYRFPVFLFLMYKSPSGGQSDDKEASVGR